MKVVDKNISNTYPAVVLGLGVNGLGVVRSLGRRGVAVYGIYTEAKELGRYSRYCRAIRFSSVKENEQEFLRQLCELGKKLSKAVLFATNDLYVRFISHYRQELSRYFLIRMADGALVDKLNSKNGIRELALAQGIKIPQTRQIVSSADVDYIKEQFSFPLIVKPSVTFNNEHFKGKKNIIIESPARLESWCAGAPGLFDGAMVQEVIRGGDDHIVMVSLYFDEHSRVIASSTVRKVRQYPPDYGIACFLKTEPLSRIKDIAVGFLEKLKFQGIILLEFAECRKTGEYYLLEANLRSCYVNQLFSDCGVDFNYIGYCDMIDPSVLSGMDFNQRENVYWLDFVRDLASFTRKHRLGQLRGLSWMASLLRSRSFAIFAWGDLCPFIVSTVRFILGGAGYCIALLTRLFKKKGKETDESSSCARSFCA